MREIAFGEVVDAVARLCVDAACVLPDDVENALEEALVREESPLGAWALEKVCRNAVMAREGAAPLCQDTGMLVVFAELGNQACIVGGLLEDAINQGVAQGYEVGYLRKSTVIDPLFDRKNTQDNTPAIVHLRMVEGEGLSLAVLPKGAGSENMSALRMLKPSAGPQGLADAVVEVVELAGGNPCPPIVVGVGVGGNAEKALELSKFALLRKLGQAHADARYAELERTILDRLNDTGIGPQGFGGTVTALAVHIEAFPTHIATLPVGVTINCHAARHKRVVL